MAKHETNINIYGGNVQVMPNVREIDQHIHTKDGKTTIINKYKNDNRRIHKAFSTDSRIERDCNGIPKQDR